MTLRDCVGVSLGNLARLKLRTFLTVCGVVIAIGTFVAMLSFGAGNRKYAEEEYEKLGLFNTMQVYPLSKQSASDTAKARVLDNAALEQLGAIPGVRLAYPYDVFSAKATVGDSQITVNAQGLSLAAATTKLYSAIDAGRMFSGDSVKEAVVTRRLMEQFHVKSPDSLVGKSIVLSVEVLSIDSGLTRVLPPNREYVRTRLRQIKYDSLLNRTYLEREVRAELNHAMAEFLNGYMNSPNQVRETLTIAGVMRLPEMRERVGAAVIVPAGIARPLSGGISRDPTKMMAALGSGNMFSFGQEADLRTYDHVTLDLEPKSLTKPIMDSVKALGFRPFSFAEQFEEIKKFFFYFDLMLSAVGIIALVTASLGIINTMVMSVLERRKEIGVLKSLGADEGDIRTLFLVESAVIGVLGSVFGILLGWVVTRIASAVAQYFFARQGLPQIDLFVLPVWLIGSALALGVLVSLIAGSYPAGRAARVDPVEALRNE